MAHEIDKYLSFLYRFLALLAYVHFFLYLCSENGIFWIIMNHGLRIKRLVSVLLVLCFTQITWANRVVLGAEQTEAYLPLLEGKRVALLSNHTGIVIQGEDTIHTLDLLLSHDVKVTAIFSPEHGFRGTAREGEKVASSVDEKTGIPILSLYDGDSKYPSKDAMATFDVLVTDIQDVGLRL